VLSQLLAVFLPAVGARVVSVCVCERVTCGLTLGLAYLHLRAHISHICV